MADNSTLCRRRRVVLLPTAQQSKSQPLANCQRAFTKQFLLACTLILFLFFGFEENKPSYFCVQAFALQQRLLVPSFQGSTHRLPLLTTQISTKSTTALHFFFEYQQYRYANEESRFSTASSSLSKLPSLTSTSPIPFIIERIPNEPNEQVFAEIAEMCIQAFFNDNEDKNAFTPPWKEWQLACLRSLQQGDLKRRRRIHANTNFMLIARRVIRCENTRAAVAAARKAPLILNLSSVYNLPKTKDWERQDYVRGEVLGFVEVTQKPYGLGSEKIGIPFDADSKILLRKLPFYNERPVLTNLSVRREARKSGLGSKLLEACENTVVKRWGMNEMILEVEDDNVAARTFYEKRGYKVLFEDPASRRYDLNGLWLRQVRCNRQVMRKMLYSTSPIVAASNNLPDAAIKSTVDLGLQALRSIRENMTSLLVAKL